MGISGKKTLEPRYLAANDGADLVVRGGGCARDVRVAVAKATRAVEVEAGGSDGRTSHGSIVDRTPQTSRTCTACKQRTGFHLHFTPGNDPFR